MSGKTMAAEDRLIFALDVGTRKEASRLVQQLAGTVKFFKVGLELFVSAGPDLVRWLSAEGFQVFLDLKIEDVSETVKRSVREVARLGASFLTIYGTAATARAAAEGCAGTNLKILSVTLLTSLNAQDLEDLALVGPHGRARFATLEEYVRWRASEALENGCQGLITSGQNAAMLRQEFGPDPVLVSPGIRPAGAASHDQKRVCTPRDAILAGADYLVVGRPIRDAADPLAAAKSIIREIDGALDQLPA